MFSVHAQNKPSEDESCIVTLSFTTAAAAAGFGTPILCELGHMSSIIPASRIRNLSTERFNSLPKWIQLMSNRCWNVNAFSAHYCLLNSKLQALNGARGVHLKLCLGSHILILIFQSSVVTGDYIKVAIKEVQMFNQDVIPPNYDVCFSQLYVTNCFINDD